MSTKTPAIVTVGRGLLERHYTARAIRVVSKSPLRTDELFRCSHRHPSDRDARACRDALAAAREANR
jgi:hypothetical protein